MTTWFLTKVKFTKEFQDGTLKRVTEQYLVHAGSFTEAEARIYEEVGEFIRGEFVVVAINRDDYADIFQYNDSDYWFKAKVAYTTSNYEGKEKRIVNKFLVTAPDVKAANERITDSFKGLMTAFEIISIESSPIIEVLKMAEEPVSK